MHYVRFNADINSKTCLFSATVTQCTWIIIYMRTV